jgi:hypothetical protein
VTEERTPGDETPDVSDITDENTTSGGYSYTVVDDDEDDADSGPARQARQRQGAGRGSRGIPPIWLAVAALVPAIVVGAIVWFVASGGGGGDTTRTEKDVANVVSAFSSGQDGSVSTRYEGELPPGIPDVPSYPGAKVVSSVVQIQGNDAAYLVIYDTTDDREKVASYLGDQFTADPWQIDAGQDSNESTLHQFSKIDDPDITGLVLVSAAKGQDLTTIVESLQVASGAKDAEKTPYAPPAARAVPDGYPDQLPTYDGSVLIQSAFQKAPSASQYAVSYITKDSQSDVMDFFRSKLGDAKLTVTDGDASQSSLEDAERINFTDDQQELTGIVTTGKLAEDPSYTRIDVQAQVSKSPGGGAPTP